jgi:uncharacterized protein involved in type VI secretion and phage assembly
VQYGETDFNFVSRLMEMEGAYFYFSHSQGSHTLVLADDIGSHSPLPNGPSTIPYYSGDRAAHVHDQDFIDGWSFAEDIASGHFAADDYDFKKPKAILDTKQQQPAGHRRQPRTLRVAGRLHRNGRWRELRPRAHRAAKGPARNRPRRRQCPQHRTGLPVHLQQIPPGRPEQGIPDRSGLLPV